MKIDTILKNLIQYIEDLFDLRHNLDEISTIENIKKGIEFKGENLWALIFAIFIASIGLNTNSTAVIIGAMLISPLMGPIVGAGLAIGTNDFETLKSSLKNLSIAVLISVITSFIYFSLTPLTQAQSELLARTNPTIFDVLIALFGGAAGIVASSRKDKGNAIPGVAIATALMPPLCTSGYGLATNNLQFFLGAFYLFFINSVFICISTIIFVRYLKFKEVVPLNPIKQNKIKNYISFFAILTLLPSVYTAWNVVNESIFNSRVIKFINETNFKNSKIINYKINYKNNEKSNIELTIIGDSLSDELIQNMKEELNKYKIYNTDLVINQSNQNINKIEEQFLTMNQNLKVEILEKLYQNNTEQIKKRDKQIDNLEKELNIYKDKLNKRIQSDNNINTEKIFKELKVYYPNIDEISYSEVIKKDKNMKTYKHPLIVLRWSNKKDISSKSIQILKYLKVRLDKSNLQVINI